MTKPLRIFIIYAREDAEFKDGLITALSPLKNQGWVESWHDSDIYAGDVWDEKIRENLEAADLILPLISAPYFASEYIQTVEIPAAFERLKAGTCRIVPVLVRACTWDTDQRLKRLQVLPRGAKPVSSWSNRDEAYHSIAEGIRQLAQEEQKWPLSSPSPSPPRFPLWWPVAAVVALAATWAVWHFQNNNTAADGETLAASYRTAVQAGTIPALNGFLAQASGLYADSARNAIASLELRRDTLVQEAEALYKGGRTNDAFERLDRAWQIDSSDRRVERLRNMWGK